MMSETQSLVLLRDGVKMLARCRTIQDAKRLADVADAARVYAKKAKLGQQAIDYAQEIKIDALALLGKMLKHTQDKRNKGGRPKTSSPEEPVLVTPTLADLDLSKKESHLAQRVADLSDESLADVKTGQKTLTQVQREIREQKREERRQENAAKAKETPDILAVGARFATILIDPPWDWGDEGDVNQLGRAKPDYSTIPYEQLLTLPVGKLADDDCHLYCWVTNRSMPKVFGLLDAWGFRYITLLTWPKPSFGMGNYFRGQTEHVVFGVKGSQLLRRKDASTLLPAWNRGERHSSKPLEFYEFIESCSPGPYLEVFGREQRDGWIVWGADSR